jgi:hypothetical protein
MAKLDPHHIAAQFVKSLSRFSPGHSLTRLQIEMYLPVILSVLIVAVMYYRARVCFCHSSFFRILLSLPLHFASSALLLTAL